MTGTRRSPARRARHTREIKRVLKRIGVTSLDSPPKVRTRRTHWGEFLPYEIMVDPLSGEQKQQLKDEGIEVRDFGGFAVLTAWPSS